jgi:hypothetical protein
MAATHHVLLAEYLQALGDRFARIDVSVCAAGIIRQLQVRRLSSSSPPHRVRTRDLPVRSIVPNINDIRIGSFGVLCMLLICILIMYIITYSIMFLSNMGFIP